MLTKFAADLTTNYGVAATGVYSLLRMGCLQLHCASPTHPAAPQTRTTKELLGIFVSVLASRTTSLTAFLDSSSDFTRAHQSLSLFGPAIGRVGSLA